MRDMESGAYFSVMSQGSAPKATVFIATHFLSTKYVEF